jgi:hypothetical protein
MNYETKVRLRKIKLLIVKTWAILKSRGSKPLHRGSYELVRSYKPNAKKPGKGRSSYKAIPVPKKKKD